MAVSVVEIPPAVACAVCSHSVRYWRLYRSRRAGCFDSSRTARVSLRPSVLAVPVSFGHAKINCGCLGAYPCSCKGPSRATAVTDTRNVPSPPCHSGGLVVPAEYCSAGNRSVTGENAADGRETNWKRDSHATDRSELGGEALAYAHAQSTPARRRIRRKVANSLLLVSRFLCNLLTNQRSARMFRPVPRSSLVILRRRTSSGREQRLSICPTELSGRVC